MKILTMLTNLQFIQLDIYYLASQIPLMCSFQSLILMITGILYRWSNAIIINWYSVNTIRFIGSHCIELHWLLSDHLLSSVNHVKFESIHKFHQFGIGGKKLKIFVFFNPKKKSPSLDTNCYWLSPVNGKNFSIVSWNWRGE